MDWQLLADYLIRLLPAIILFAGVVILLPSDKKGIRIMLYIMLFIVIRDLMTPLGFWSFGTEGGFWIRFIDQPWLLVLFGLSCLGIVAAIYLLDKDSRESVVWLKGNKAFGILMGITGALVVVLPLFLIYLNTPIAQRGGEVAMNMIPALLIVTLFGNLYEEFLFRGLFQGYIEKSVSGLKAGILSGFMFGFGHVFLALTVTDVGIPLLLFTLWEGILCGLIRWKWGTIPATLTHGLAIFILSSGLI